MTFTKTYSFRGYKLITQFKVLNILGKKEPVREIKLISPVGLFRASFVIGFIVKEEVYNSKIQQLMSNAKTKLRQKVKMKTVSKL